MATFKYNDMTVTLNENTGKFSAEGMQEYSDWVSLKRKIDTVSKQKYEPVKAVYFSGRFAQSRNGMEVVITRPKIGETKYVWIKNDEGKRETCNIGSLYSIDHLERINRISAQIQEHEKCITELCREAEALSHAETPKPIP